MIGHRGIRFRGRCCTAIGKRNIEKLIGHDRNFGRETGLIILFMSNQGCTATKKSLR